MKHTLSGKTRLFAVIGDPISHTASPKMHNAAYLELGIDACYVAFKVDSDNVQKALDGIRTLGIGGINVTVPHKEAALPFLDEIDPLANAIGAVNTIINHDGKLKGYNTDGLGFILSLQEDKQYHVAGKTIAILGCGGSAKAIAYTLLLAKPAKLLLLNRTLSKAQTLAAQLPPVTTIESHPLDQTDILKNCDLIINTTSVGLAPNLDDSPISDFSWAHEGQLVVDIIYNPPQTAFLRQAKAKGADTHNGAGMLAGQGMLAFEKFTGQSIPYSFFLKTLLSQ